jgi:hypothetical protein
MAEEEPDWRTVTWLEMHQLWTMVVLVYDWIVVEVYAEVSTLELVEGTRILRREMRR